MIDLKEMSRKELLELRDRIDKEVRNAEQRERRNALKAAEEAAAKFGYSLDELSGEKKSKSAAKLSRPKYRNPDNAMQTWSGRGRKPQWFHDATARGLDPSDLEI